MPNYAKDYRLSEMMCVAAAHQIQDGERVFAGAGLPLLASILALRAHAPNIEICLESGVVGALFPEDPLKGKSPLPRFVMDPRICPGATYRSGLLEVNGLFLPKRKFDVGFLGGAQVDRYGNLNSTLIGDNWVSPKVWLPGSGGAGEIAMYANRVLIIMAPHDKRRFCEKVDMITSPGYLNGPGSREAHGLKWGGPAAVVSTLGVLGFDPESKEMTLKSVYPGVTVKQVKEDTAWDLRVAPGVDEVEPPTVEEIEIIRTVDREGLYTGRG
ncbi:MAG: CoA-transferase subunit beta [Ignavibacteriales bacterium]